VITTGLTAATGATVGTSGGGGVKGATGAGAGAKGGGGINADVTAATVAGGSDDSFTLTPIPPATSKLEKAMPKFTILNSCPVYTQCPVNHKNDTIPTNHNILAGS